jgi:predicted DNA-binding protein (MmcQ/YjbR family)
MDIGSLYQLCLAKKGVTEHFPFDENTLVFKVGNKMFCLVSLKAWETGDKKLNLKCNPEKAVLLRERYEAVKPGYHMSKIHWNTVTFGQDLPTTNILALIDHSYDLIVQSLPKKVREDFGL